MLSCYVLQRIKLWLAIATSVLADWHLSNAKICPNKPTKKCLWTDRQLHCSHGASQITAVEWGGVSDLLCHFSWWCECFLWGSFTSNLTCMSSLQSTLMEQLPEGDSLDPLFLSIQDRSAGYKTQPGGASCPASPPVSTLSHSSAAERTGLSPNRIMVC